MDALTRRTVMQLGIAGLPLTAAGLARGATRGASRGGPEDLEALGRIVKFHGDGPSHAPAESVALLEGILATRGIEADYYSNGGVVAELEARMAELLGKERAVFLPTGTLANHLAVRIQANGDRRVVVQNDSHLYCDSGDCAETLSSLNMVPLAHGKGTFTLEELAALVERTDSGRVHTGVGVVSIESPIRRRFGELFEIEEMRRVCAWAHERGIRTHLDGARLFMASGYTGIAPRVYAALFDTVYVSLWKYFWAPSGAVLAGPAALLDELFHTRRMFGGGLPAAWPLAALSLAAIDGFEDRFAAGVRAGEEVLRRLDAVPGLRVERTPNGSNVFRLHVDASDLEAYAASAARAGIELATPQPWGFPAGVNETWTRRPVDEIVAALTPRA